MKVSELTSKKIAILGFGKEGQSSFRFCKKIGVTQLTVIDQKLSPQEIQKISESFGEIIHSQDIYTGKEIEVGLRDAESIIKTPGISPFQEVLLPYREKFISGTEIFFSFYTGKVVGITATKGKSTTSTLIYQLLQTLGYRVKLVGNIGTPVLDEIQLGDEKNYDYIVYEMSSYMLQDFSPELYIGFLGNINPCHLDWHQESFTVYKQAKLNILLHAEIQILHGNFIKDALIKDIIGVKNYFGNEGNFRVKNDGIYLREKLFLEKKDIALEGKHNMENICGVLEVLSHIVHDTQKLKKISLDFFPHFAGLPHRIEHIASIAKIDFIDDSIATTPESTMAAIDTFDGKLQVLLLGGENSGFDFSGLRKKILSSSITHIVAFPDTSEIIFPEIVSNIYGDIRTCNIDGKILTFFKTRSMKDAVDFAFESALPETTVLLSSASPSFSVWKNYLQKAEQFSNAVKNLPHG